MHSRSRLPLLCLALVALFLSVTQSASAQGQETYRITITNLTAGQIISPPVAAVHRIGTGIFKPGTRASAAVAAVAEDADATILLSALAADDRVLAIVREDP